MSIAFSIQKSSIYTWIGPFLGGKRVSEEELIGVLGYWSPVQLNHSCSWNAKIYCAVHSKCRWFTLQNMISTLIGYVTPFLKEYESSFFSSSEPYHLFSKNFLHDHVSGIVKENHGGLGLRFHWTMIFCKTGIPPKWWHVLSMETPPKCSHENRALGKTQGLWKALQKLKSFQTNSMPSILVKIAPFLLFFLM